MTTKNNIPEERGFKTPPSYFITSKETILNSLKIESSTGKSRPFDIPENYFENQKIEMLDLLLRKRNEVKDIENTQSKVISLNKYYYTLAGIAAAVLIFVSIYYTQYQNTPSQNFEMTSITNYLEDNTDLDGIDFADWLSEEDISTLQNDIALEDASIIEYLEDRTDSYDLYTQY